MIEANNPEINVNELMQKIREEVAKRNNQSQPSFFSNSKTEPLTKNLTINHIDALLKNAEARAYIRTKWPDKLNRFPFNLSKGVQKLALELINFMFKDQREVNLNLISSLKESLTLNRELTTEITTLRSQIETLETKLEKSLVDIDSQVESVREENERLKVMDNRIQALAEKLNIIEPQISGWTTEVQEHWGVLKKQVQEIDDRHIRNDSYLKNDLIQQKRLINLFIEQAQQRLPEPFNSEQLQTFVEEGKHSLDAFYVAFEDRFRGSREGIRARLKVYLPSLEAAKVGTADSPILDVGCGRGEWLELLRDSGFTARGIDINRVMLEQCHAQGLEAIESDVIAHLKSLPDSSLGAVTGFHIIEHLPFSDLINLIDETFRVLSKDGLAIFESPNPENLIVGACNFYSDPTHRNPLYPLTIQFLFEQRGFLDVQLLRLREHRLEDPLQLIESDDPIASKLNPLIEIAKFNFYAAPDFAVIAKKA